MIENKETYEVTPEVKRSIIQRKIALFGNSIYDAQLDAKVARLLEDKPTEDRAAEQIKRMLKAIELLETELAKLPPAVL